MEVVNCVYRGNLILRQRYDYDNKLDLLQLYNDYEEFATLYTGRPTQLKIKFNDDDDDNNNSKTVIIFPSGAVRVMGLCGEIEAMLVLYRIFADYHTHVTIPGSLQLQTMTLCGKLSDEVNLYKLSQLIGSNAEFELFTGLRITKYNPLCVNVFASGAFVITGCKDIETADNIYHELCILAKKCTIQKICNTCKYQLQCKCTIMI